MRPRSVEARFPVAASVRTAHSSWMSPNGSRSEKSSSSALVLLLLVLLVGSALVLLVGSALVLLLGSALVLLVGSAGGAVVGGLEKKLGKRTIRRPRRMVRTHTLEAMVVMWSNFGDCPILLFDFS